MKIKSMLWAVAALSGGALLASAQESSERERLIAEAAEALRPQLVEWRRDFHRHPELSNREERTARVVAEKLRAWGVDELRTNVAHHGVVAVIKGGRPGPVVAVRADMDALPIHETLDVPYKSLVPNVKHACGHDVHTTVQLGVAEILCQMRDLFPGSVKLLFQPAEEGAPAGEEGGAELMIREGALENPKPAAIFGLHVSPEIPAGKVGFCSGGAQASADSLHITVRGKMAHGADPHKGVDAIVAAAHCITALQTIRSRRTDTFEPLVVTIGTIQGGRRGNIIADEVNMTGTVRTLDRSLRRQVKEQVKQTLDGVTAAFGAAYELRYGEGTSVVYNDPVLVEETLPAMRRMAGGNNVVPAERRMGAEDFSAYQEVVPGFFYRLGTGNAAKGITAEPHTPEFDVDEDCLPVGVKVMAGVLTDFLERNAAKTK